MTKDDWAKVEKALSGTCGKVTLLVDGRAVLFERGRISKNRLGIAVFVDGNFKGEWVVKKNNCPESKYLHPTWSYRWNAKSRAQMKKMSKTALKRLKVDPDAKVEHFSPLWPSPTAIRRHYQKSFAEIKLVEVVGW